MNARVVWNGGVTGIKGQVAWSFEVLRLSYVQPQKIGRWARDSQRDPYATDTGQFIEAELARLLELIEFVKGWLLVC
ncbi:hypothetical protein SLEP1_g59013 [Rubroshorea leprosula]|uniref:Uncharacterized protein n=1 Tax=Rubroshorea leprosula TaxID=152421 RepID=A0AAV5MR37_9ROSI|nr:hypothetical protein SLEP1_g59013 [Rubroshorea leprosula]